MLAQLTVKNFALIKTLTLDFHARLNVFTGQTGAGKSILIDALQLALGSRSEQAYFRDDNSDIFVQATFDLASSPIRNHALLEDAFSDDSDNLVVLKRIITNEGRNKCYVNDALVNVSKLKAIGSILLDIHGQSDHQLILNPDEHIELIDRYAEIFKEDGYLNELKRCYTEFFKKYKKLNNEKIALESKDKNKARELDLLKYQISEIEDVKPQIDEDFSLVDEKTRLAHSERLYELTNNILQLFDDDNVSVSSLIANSFKDMHYWEKIDESVNFISKKLENVQAGAEDFIAEVRAYQESLSFDSARLQEIENRLDSIEMLKKKYGPSLNEVNSFLAIAKEKYDQLENYDNYLKVIREKIDKVMPGLEQAASKLSKLRKRSITELSKSIESELNELGIKSAKFSCDHQKGAYSLNGNDAIEFLFQANEGQSLKPLAQIASGGEASRVMLAIKKSLAQVDNIPTLIFDEIDANIGGRLGSIVGSKVKAISSQRQVLLITHLPQIASFGDMHIKVLKVSKSGATSVDYQLLDGESRIEELSQMMSGDKKTSISRAHAEEMLEAASSA